MHIAHQQKLPLPSTCFALHHSSRNRNWAADITFDSPFLRIPTEERPKLLLMFKAIYLLDVPTFPTHPHFPLDDSGHDGASEADAPN